jgi:uncharacterized protein DUF3750
MISRSRLFWILLLPLYTACSTTYIGHSGQLGGSDWRSASREPVGLAPDPASTPEAVVQVYAARTVGWRGYLGVHTWIAVKPSHVDHFTIHEVIGYRLRRTGTVVVSGVRAPDARWFGAYPQLLRDVRGPGVDALITRIESAVERYPYAKSYHVWPGPNSNTFTAFVLREVPELRVDLPPTAIGKDYLGITPVALTPSGTGGQVSVLGVAGITAGWEEGVEINVLGLTFGLDPLSLSIKLPLLGRIGPSESQPVLID